jgi:hypothetical protein
VMAFFSSGTGSLSSFDDYTWSVVYKLCCESVKPKLEQSTML